MYLYIEPYILPCLALLVLFFIGRALIKARQKGAKNGCGLGCFGLITLVLAGPLIGCFFNTKGLCYNGTRRWYLHTYDIDGTTFYSVHVSPMSGLSETEEPWYCRIGFQGGEAGWKKHPTELYLRQKSGALHYFNFETEEVQDLGNVPVDVPMYPVEQFFRQL